MGDFILSAEWVPVEGILFAGMPPCGVAFDLDFNGAPVG
jgi:hypothetical protein